MSPPSPIRFFFDFVSPYSYLAWTQIHALAERHGRTVEPAPILFAGLLNAHGTRGPAEVPAKRIYLAKDIARLAHKLNVPITLPPAHPFNPLQALRLSSVRMGPAATQADLSLIHALFNAVWRDGRNLEDPRVLEDIATSVGLERSTIAEAASPEAKARVRARTDEALALDIFGVPTMLVDREMFYGCDSLPHLDDFLRGDQPNFDDYCNRWNALGASAKRSLGSSPLPTSERSDG